MKDSTVWWLLAGAAVALELLSGTFYLLMLALGLAAAALAAQLGAGPTVQLGAAALIGGGAVLLWSQLARQRTDSSDRSDSQDLNLDIGQIVQVGHWRADGSAQVRHRGAEWTVELDQPAVSPAAGRYRIVAVRGSHLIVQAQPE